MKPRPVYRWKSFWLGVLVMAFLGWAWWISYDYSSRVSWGGFGVSQQAGYVTVASSRKAGGPNASHVPVKLDPFRWQKLPPPFFARGEGKPFEHLLPKDGMEFREHAMWSYSFSPKDLWGAFLPHWLLMLVFLGPWAGYLAWRWRRQQRLTESIA